MKKLACTLFLTVGVINAFAAADTPESAGAPDASAPAQQKIELKTRSSFVLEETARSPFWPIGWRPTPVRNTNSGEHGASEVQSGAFTVTSITVDSTGRYAIVNGKVMNEGQVFGLQIGNQTYQITVKAIQDGQVILQRRDQEIAVPLRRR
jgi:hypothetical protein